MPRIPTLLRPLSAVALLTGGLCVACTTDSDSTAGATATPETSDGTTTASDADAATTGEPGETGETEPVDGSTGEAEPELGDALERIASPVLDPRQNDSPITGEPTMLGIFDPCAVWDPRDERWRVYFTFADNVAETSGLARAGLAGAVSSDPTGTSFVVNDGLAVEQLGTFDSESVETCDVIVDPFSETRRFLLYYSGNRGVTDSDYVVALATSDDGVRFDALAPELARDGEAGVLFGVEEALGGMAAEGNFVTDPVVAFAQGSIHMWTLCVVQVPEPNGGICHAVSDDGITWEHLGLVDGLDRGFPIQPTVFFNPQDNLFEMYVVMDTPDEEARIHDLEVNLTLRVTGFYHATSPDGHTWTWDPMQAFGEDTSLPWEDLGLATAADAELRDDEVFFFYPSLTTAGGSVLPPLANWPLNLAMRRAF